MTRWSLLLLLLGLVGCAPDEETACQLQHPVVLSHHWGARPICDPSSELPCEETEPGALCAEWDGGRCARWQIPDADLELPPRERNAFDPDLRRETRHLHRYYSREVVERITECGNAVFLSDKPIFAAYDVRARSLRRTVLEALEQSGAEQVVVVGMSQGVQDARFLASLPVDDADPDGPRMARHLAAIVSAVGEQEGAETADILLTFLYAGRTTAGAWLDPAAQAIPVEELRAYAWTLDGTLVLSEDALAPLDDEALIAHALASLAGLSTRYMLGVAEYLRRSDELGAPGSLVGERWDSLMLATGITGDWPVIVGNAAWDVPLFGYSAAIRTWDPRWGSSVAYDLLGGLWDDDSDGYVTVGSQRVAGHAQNAVDAARMQGQAKDGTHQGVHHMFFTGRNDSLYAPQGTGVENTCADFYERVLRDLSAGGF